jgi:anti-sigma factor RsiW
VTSKHLGESIHDLLDGRLRGDKAYAAMAHLGECEDCASRFHELKRARDALTSSEAGIDMRFAQKLLDRERIAEIAAGDPSLSRKGRRPVRRAPVVAAAALVVIAVVLVGVAWQVGAPGEVTLAFTAPRQSGAAPVAYANTQQMRSGDLLQSWIHPDFSTSGVIPVEATVVQRADGGLVLVASILAGPEGKQVTVVQEHGYLSPSATSQMPRADVNRAEVYVVENEGYSPMVVWQTGDVVVALSCECSLTTLESVAEEFPAASDPGFADRIGQGFSTLASAVHH